jgi:hypothetical protein
LLLQWLGCLCDQSNGSRSVSAVNGESYSIAYIQGVVKLLTHIGHQLSKQG